MAIERGRLKIRPPRVNSESTRVGSRRLRGSAPQKNCARPISRVDRPRRQQDLVEQRRIQDGLEQHRAG